MKAARQKKAAPKVCLVRLLGRAKFSSLRLSTKMSKVADHEGSPYFQAVITCKLKKNHHTERKTTLEGTTWLELKGPTEQLTTYTVLEDLPVLPCRASVAPVLS